MAKPVVLDSTVSEVDVKEETVPSMVVTMVVTSREVDLPINAEVMVVLDVLLLLVFEEDVEDVRDEDGAACWEVVPAAGVVRAAVVGVLEVGGVFTGVVVVTGRVLVVVKVVGVLFDVVVTTEVVVSSEVTTVLEGAAVGVVVVAAASDVVTPVPPACLLLKTPSMMG